MEQWEVVHAWLSKRAGWPMAARRWAAGGVIRPLTAPLEQREKYEGELELFQLRETFCCCATNKGDNKEGGRVCMSERSKNCWTVVGLTEKQQQQQQQQQQQEQQ